jgi:3-dehydrosphinganine reductase
MILTTILTAAVLLATTYLSMGLFTSKWNPKGKHCYVTGGSTGLGLALAVLLTKKGADVSIVARDEKKLDIALAELEKVRQTSAQILKSYSYSLTDPKLSVEALEAACAEHGGRTPDVVFLCAGASQPRFFVESEVGDLQQGMENGFWVQAHSAWAAARRMVKTRTQGKIVLVGSVLSYFSMVGYSSYSPAKHALRGMEPVCIHGQESALMISDA